MKNWNLLLHVSRTSWYYLMLFAVAFVGDILPGAIPNASVPFGIPIAILLRWLLAEWLGLQVSAQLQNGWGLMELDQRRSNFSPRKLSTKSNSGVPARGHLERTSLCGNWLPMASSGTKKWECCARDDSWPCGVHHKSCGAFLWYIIPTVRRMGNLRSRHANVLLELHWCRRDFCIWYLLLEPNGGRTSRLRAMSAMFFSVQIRRKILLRQQTSRSWWLTSWSLAWSLIRWSWWVDVRLMFVFKTQSSFAKQVGIITPYEGQRVIVSVFWLYFVVSLDLRHSSISFSQGLHMLCAATPDLLQSQGYNLKLPICQSCTKNIKGNQGNLFLFTLVTGSQDNEFCRGLWGDWGCQRWQLPGSREGWHKNMPWEFPESLPPSLATYQKTRKW